VSNLPAVPPVLATALAAALVASPLAAQDAVPAPGPAFDVVEATVAEVHAAMEAGRLTARWLVQAYLARVEAYDDRGPALNAILRVNPGALARADSLDAAFRRTGRLTGPLHGIPLIVKDNYDVAGMPTTAGSASLEGSVPPDDAFQVRRLEEAGAIVLAKSAMAEFAFSPYETVGSSWPGYTFNPYALNRVTAGSSGGTAAAVSASFGTVGLGTDTGNSIRGPSSHTALVGIRSTMGLTSRDGIVPLYLDRDIGGPMARTVEDAVRVFDVIAGSDPADSVTAPADARRPASYLDFLDADALDGARLGVLTELVDDTTADPRVMERFRGAVEELRRAGATVVDVSVPEIDTLSGSRWCRRFAHDIRAYLATLDDPPVTNLDEIVEGEKYHVSIADRLEFFQRFQSAPEEDEGCRESARNSEVMRAGVRRAMRAAGVAALIYPSWLNPPRLIGDLESPHGNNSPHVSPPTGFPALTVPMGFVAEAGLPGPGLPVGLQMLGDAWSEPTLIRLAYAYEQATHHRRPPPTTPPLGAR
jgi:Asp-tRNA(Asn)/Glu-tRNA(Gln) amidotransferase A subunit family amidase